MPPIALDSGLTDNTMTELDDALHAQIQGLCAQGDECVDRADFSPALEKYRAALALLPEPLTQWSLSTSILIAIGDVNFLRGDFVASHDALLMALDCPEAFDEPFLHFRLGQCHFHLGELDRAADQLGLAYQAAGEDMFEGAEHYLAFLKSRRKTIIEAVGSSPHLPETIESASANAPPAAPIAKDLMRPVDEEAGPGWARIRAALIVYAVAACIQLFLAVALDPARETVRPGDVWLALAVSIVATLAVLGSVFVCCRAPDPVVARRAALSLVLLVLALALEALIAAHAIDARSLQIDGRRPPALGAVELILILFAALTVSATYVMWIRTLSAIAAAFGNLHVDRIGRICIVVVLLLIALRVLVRIEGSSMTGPVIGHFPLLVAIVATAGNLLLIGLTVSTMFSSPPPRRPVPRTPPTPVQNRDDDNLNLDD